MVQDGDGDSSVRDPLSVWTLFELFAKVLAGPMFVVLSMAPQPTFAEVVDFALPGHPDFRAVLSVVQGQFGPVDKG